MAVNGLENGAWDGATCVKLRWGTEAVPCLKVESPKLEIKVEKIRRIGEMLATKRTPGVAELAAMKVSLLTTDYARSVLKHFGKHAGTEIEFVLTATIVHPAVFGQLSRLVDHCRILSVEGPTIESTEKGLVTDLMIDGLDLWERGNDNVWKTLVRKSNLTSADAKALLAF